MTQKELKEEAVKLKKHMFEYFGSLPMDLTYTLDEIIEYIQRNTNERNRP